MPEITPHENTSVAVLDQKEISPISSQNTISETKDEKLDEVHAQEQARDEAKLERLREQFRKREDESDEEWENRLETESQERHRKQEEERKKQLEEDSKSVIDSDYHKNKSLEPETVKSEYPITEPLKNRELEEKEYEAIRVKLQYDLQNSEFLDVNDPMVQKLQSYVDRMQDPNAAPMRVLVAKNTLQSNGYVFGDGTMVLTQALINDMDYEEELVAIMAHEQVHFEKGHHHKDQHVRKEDTWLTKELRTLGRMRTHEYHADLALTAKLDSLGLDTLSFESAIQKIGRVRNATEKKGKKRETIDVVHGSPSDRALNTILAHNLVDFPSSNQTIENRTPIDLTWKREVHPSVMELLQNPPSDEAWRLALGTAKPYVFYQYMNYLIDDASRTVHQTDAVFYRDDFQKSRDNLRKLDTAMELIHARLEAKGVPEDTLKLATLLCATVGTGSKFRDFEDLTENSSRAKVTRGNLTERTHLSWMIAAADLTPEAMGSLLDLHKEGKIYHLAGLPVIKERDEYPSEVLADSGHNLVRYLVKENEAPIGEAAMLSIADNIHGISTEISNRYGEEKGKRFFDSEVRRLIAQRVESHPKTRDLQRKALVTEVGTVIRSLSEKYGTHFSTGYLREIASRIEDTRILRKIGTDSIASKTQKYFVEQLRPPNTSFTEIITNRDSEGLIALMQSDPDTFQKYLAHMKQRSPHTERETSQWLIDNILSNYQVLSETNRKVPLTVNEKLQGLQGAVDPEVLSDDELQRYAKLHFALSSIVLVTAGEDIDNRSARFVEFFSQESVQSDVNELSITSLDNIARYVINESQRVEDGHPTEKAFDIQKPNYLHYVSESNQGNYLPRAQADTLVHLPVFRVLRDKLLVENPETDFQQALQIHDYYSELLSQYYWKPFYIPKDSFWGASVEIAEEVVPVKTRLLESFGNFDFTNGSAEDVATYVKTVRLALPSEYDSREIVNVLVGQIVEKLPFEDALEFMESMAQENDISLEVVNTFIEKRINTLEDYRNCKESIARVIDGFITNPSIEMGKAVVADTAAEAIIRHAKPTELLEMLVLSGTNDTEFRRRLSVDYIKYITHEGFINGGYKLSSREGKIEVVGPGAHTFKTFEEFVSELQGASESQKMLIMRKLFLADNGILKNPENHKKVVDMFMGQIEQDATLAPLLRTIMTSTLSAGDPVRMFLPIANALSPFLLRRPEVAGENGPAAEAIYEWGKGNMARNLGIDKSAWTKEEIANLLNVSKSKMEADILSSQPATAEIYNAYQSYLTRLKESIGFQKSTEGGEVSLEKAAPIEVVLRFGQGFGPVGKRFLQVLGQYINLPPEYEESFREVYDSNPGQSKFSVFAMLDSEARGDEQTKHFIDEELISVDEKIGGGSIMTSYEMTTRGENGEETAEVLKVKNPNAERFVIESIVEARKVVADLQRRDRKNAGNYVIAGRLLDTIEQWVLEDIRDDSFMGLDPIFAEVHNGFQTTAGPVVEIGRVGEPNNANIKRELKVAGITLNKLLGETSDPEKQGIAKVAVSAVAEDFARQLTVPASTGENGELLYLVHSDIHPGNEIVSSGGETVHPIDRNYYLQLSKDDVDFVHTVLSDSEPQQKLSAMVSYFLAQPENSERQLDPQTVTREIYSRMVKDEALKRLRGQESSNLELMNKVLQELDRRNIDVPLRLRILNKNLDSVNHMLEVTQQGSFITYFDTALQASKDVSLQTAPA